MSLDVYFGLNQWVGWGKSDLITEIRPGLLVSDRHSFASCVDANIPALTELPLSVCGCRKFNFDPPWDHLSSCTTHSRAKKDHDWEVDQIVDLFLTHTVKTQEVARSRGQRRGDIGLTGYLSNVSGPVRLVLDLRIVHESPRIRE